MTQKYGFIKDKRLIYIGFNENQKIDGFNIVGIKIQNLNIEKISNGFDIEEINGNIIYSEGENYINIQKQKIDNEIQKIKDNFDIIINKYLSKYSKSEIEQFPNKLAFAKNVISGGESIYITNIANRIGITPKEFSQIIIDKALEFEIFYTEEENKRDSLINTLNE